MIRYSIAVVVALALAPAPQQPATAFVDVTVIPMGRERVLEHQTVVVSGGRIAAMGPHGSTSVPSNAVVVDGRGKYLLPGLGDAHAHLSTPGGGTALARRALTLYALSGVTMVRSMYTEPHHLAAVADIARGTAIGPHAVVVSPALHGGSAQTPQAARDSVRKYKVEGFPVIKVLPGMSRAVFDTLAAAARAENLPLAGHVPATVGLEAALAAGFVSVEHLDGLIEALARPGTSAPSGFFGLGMLDAIDEGRIARIVAMVKSSGVTIVPTEFSMEAYTNADSTAMWLRRPELQYAPPALVQMWGQQKEGFVRNPANTAERAARYRDIRRRLIRELHAAGVPIAVGSDAFTMFGVPGFATIEEMEILVASGLSPFQALAAATTEVARLLKLDGVTGTITVGGVADLVLVGRNPLDDISNLRHPAGVVLRGIWYDRAKLDSALAAQR